ncbi:MAG: DUF3987 domain-containing protein, partial [Cyanobacteriota bacterium]|nr:DUF3987 domain-containing protein [Cyanobacteriota bacterium]
IDLARQNRSAVEGWKAENQGKKPLERSEPPRPVFLSCSQFTGESLTRQLATQEEHGLGFLINREELSGLLGDVNAYRGGRGSDREQLLEAFDGSGASTLRVSEESGGRFYGRCQLSIFGTIQPRVLQQLVSETDGDASGLWARFLFLPVPDRVIPIPLADDESEVQEMEAARLLLEGVIGKIWRMPRKSLALDAAARAAFVGYEQRCQGDALRAELPAVSAAWGKAAGKVLRVAGLLHLIHIAAGADLDGLVPEATLLAAANLVDHLTGWSLGLHQAAAGASGASDLMRLVHRVAQAAGVPITWRDVSPKLSRKARTEVDSAAAGLAVDALVRLGVGVRGEGKRAGSWTYQATRNLPS